MNHFWREVNRHFFAGSLDESAVEPVAGGDICQAYRLRLDDGTLYFAKRHPNFALLKAEFMNLRALAQAPVKKPPPPGLSAYRGAGCAGYGVSAFAGGGG